MGVSSRTAYKWLRFKAEGPSGLLDRSSRPHHSPQVCPAQQVQQFERLRRQRLPL
jgi:transposase